MTDIVERLRERDRETPFGNLFSDAADEIERLRAVLDDMIEISTRNSDPALMLLAIRKCALHALEQGAER